MGAFFKFSEHFFDQHELVSFTYMIYCVKDYVLYHRKSV